MRARTAFRDVGINWPIVDLDRRRSTSWRLAAPFFFSWPALVSCIALAVITGSFGVCMGYHRLLTHKSFQTYRPIRWLLALLGGLSGEGSALMWVANHRKHHAFSDHEGDPHSPNDGAWWSHMLWFMPNFGRKWHEGAVRALRPRHAQGQDDRGRCTTCSCRRTSSAPACCLLIGYFGPESWGLGSNWAGWSMVFWGLGVRMVYVLHVTWFVNSATHLWGYRNYETTDNSRNLWWVGLLAFGEGWHNNHHAYQRVARQGHRWWEIDVTYWAIWLMEKVRPGLGRGPGAGHSQGSHAVAFVAKRPAQSPACGSPAAIPRRSADRRRRACGFATAASIGSKSVACVRLRSGRRSVNW